MSGPSVGRAHSVAVVGLRAVDVTVEAHVGGGLPGFGVIGSSGAAAREAADRVRVALSAIEACPTTRKVLLSLAPADVPKAGARFDLAMAVAVMARLGIVPQERVSACGLLGELSLDARVRPVTGVLPSAARLAAGGRRRLLVARANAAEAALVEDLEVVGVEDLAEVRDVLSGQKPARGFLARPSEQRSERAPFDLADVRGQAEARRALELAAAGGHHLLLIGPPGCGKSMLANRLPGILPELSRAQALELAAIRSVAGLLGDGQSVLDRTPPFRAPHHTTTTAALLGGGTGVARPGELSLAHRGCLFMDELFEWSRSLLEALREPLEDGVVRVARSRATVTYPARVQLVAAANPCPCGGGESCDCSDEAIWAYRARLSGPLADRLDLAPAVAPLTADDLLATRPGESSPVVAQRVAAARALAAGRWGHEQTNADAPTAAIRATVERRALRGVALAVERGELTGRGYDRTLRVARTCADLAGAEAVTREHVWEALAHRAALSRSRRVGAGP